ncbi:hypothetical protein WH357_14000 [Enterobacter ludwigii]
MNKTNSEVAAVNKAADKRAAAQKKRQALTVYLDDDLALALNRVREEIREKSTEAGMTFQLPTLGWLTRTMLREKLGLVDSKIAKQDTPGAV